jgi:hypothetical protein
MGRMRGERCTPLSLGFTFDWIIIISPLRVFQIFEAYQPQAALCASVVYRHT